MSTLKGKGTEGNPYKIRTVEELQFIQNDLAAHYELTQDIDATSTRDWNNEKGFYPIGNKTDFTGTLQGNNHTISGLFINRPNRNKVGLFARIKNARISEVNLENIDVKGSQMTGGLIGKQITSTISHVSVTGDVTGENIVGGITGRLRGDVDVKTNTFDTGLINRCSSCMTVNGEQNTGGAVGTGRYTAILSSSIINKVTGTPRRGHFIGSHTHGKIMNSWGVTTDKSILMTGKQNGKIKNTNLFVFNEVEELIIDDDSVDVRIEFPQYTLHYDGTNEVMFIQSQDKKYKVSMSPVIVQELVELHQENIRKITDDFKAKIVTHII